MRINDRKVNFLDLDAPKDLGSNDYSHNVNTKLQFLLHTTQVPREINTMDWIADAQAMKSTSYQDIGMLLSGLHARGSHHVLYHIVGKAWCRHQRFSPIPVVGRLTDDAMDAVTGELRAASPNICYAWAPIHSSVGAKGAVAVDTLLTFHLPRNVGSGTDETEDTNHLVFGYRWAHSGSAAATDTWVAQMSVRAYLSPLLEIDPYRL